MHKREYFNSYELICKKIFKERKTRVHPQKDDKILTDWNGLMISALSRAAAVTGSDQYKDICVHSMKNATFLMGWILNFMMLSIFQDLQEFY